MRIAIVNDMKMAVEILRRIISETPGFEVAWTAFDGVEAVEKCAADVPDLILMDLIMPSMDGVEATRRIMKDSPCGILVVTATVDGNSSKVFDALGAGALDAVNTPSIGTGGGVEGAKELLRKINMLGRLASALQPQKAENEKPKLKTESHKKTPFLVAIGSSTGGPSALVRFFSSIPEDINAAFVVAQHVDKQFAPGLVSWLNDSCKLHVKLAVSGDFPEPGTVHVAGTNDHLTISKDMNIFYTSIPENNPFRPSVDVFFNSVACNWKGKGAAAILTGIGRDGSTGLLALKNAGWSTFAQDKESCVVYGMPKAAVEAGAVCEVCSPEEIGKKITKLAQSH